MKMMAWKIYVINENNVYEMMKKYLEEKKAY